MDRYERNGIINQAEQDSLKHKKVCIIGCGGLGGYAIEMLARFGVGQITVVDGDVFNESNLNRQLLCMTQTIGKSKAFTASERINEINPEILVSVIATYLDSDNVLDMLSGHDVVVDALDSNETRLIVLDACKRLGIPFVHGAIAGWYGQVSTVFPEDVFVKNFLEQTTNHGIEKNIGNPSFTPALIASYQVAETVKVLLNRGNLMREKVLFIDLINNEIEWIE